MRWCTSCILPDTRPGIVMGADGICNACKNSGRKQKEINWDEREKAFRQLVEHVKLRTNRFDCLIPVSGGKDSTWQVVKCLEYGLRPLTVTWKTPVRTAIGQKNLDNLVRLGVDHVDWQVNPEVEKKFLLKAFEKYGATAIPMHMALFNIPLSIAVKFDIPLVVWGENSAFEYGGADEALMGFRLDSKWLSAHGVTHGTTAHDWIDSELSEKDLSSYFGPTDEELEERDIKAIFMGYYFKWDVETSLKVAKAHGFEIASSPRTGIYNYADLDDDFISIHHWMKWYKFGFTRSFDNLSLEIRNGRLTRYQALEILKERGEERPVSDIQKFCAFISVSEDRFFKAVERYRNLGIWYRDLDIWKIRDFLIPDWRW
ncbi:MAG: N-acetyl sugar amidotransferase [Gammaproteobacteria bacterium]|nr:N-acetyl sugar amidotransferase [Gammaproteobacteria bacterium]